MMVGKSKDLKRKGVRYDDSYDERESRCDLLLMKLNLVPRKKLLVLSIGGLLCHRVCRKDLSIAPIYNRIPDASYGSYKVYKMPYCKDFMEFCLERFEVGIWSSSREWYMNNALNCMMVLANCYLLGIKMTTNSGFNSLDKEDKPIYLQELEKIWLNKHSILPVRAGQYSSSNTLIIDNDPYKALLNPLNTAVYGTEYKAGNVIDNALGFINPIKTRQCSRQRSRQISPNQSPRRRHHYTHSLKSPLIFPLTCLPQISPPSFPFRRVIRAIDAVQPFDYESLLHNQYIKCTSLKIAIIDLGNFGQFLLKGFARHHHTLLVHSRSDHSPAVRQHLNAPFFTDLNDLCEHLPDVLLLSTSILSTESVLKSIPFQRLKRSTLFVDVLSVKEFPRNLFLKYLPPWKLWTTVSRHLVH